MCTPYCRASLTKWQIVILPFAKWVSSTRLGCIIRRAFNSLTSYFNMQVMRDILHSDQGPSRCR